MSPPSSGWKIVVLPESAQHLRSVWAAHPSRPKNAKAAWLSMLEFLAANGIKGNKITDEVKLISVDQWCSPEPRRCQGFNKGKPKAVLPWARERWEWANGLLSDGAENPGALLADIVADLTARITGPEGCILCAAHWSVVLMEHPVPASPTLQQARHWLVDIHNETREGKSPVPFATVAAKFNWTTPV